jgi:signal transduction histidine kinase
MNGAIEAAKIEPDKKGISIRFEVPGEIPPLILVDPAMIDRVIANLLDNTITYTDREGMLTVRPSEADNEILFGNRYGQRHPRG